jgi:hypothetical protein
MRPRRSEDCRRRRIHLREGIGQTAGGRPGRLVPFDAPATPESILHAIGLVAHHRERNDPGLAHD